MVHVGFSSFFLENGYRAAMDSVSMDIRNHLHTSDTHSRDSLRRRYAKEYWTTHDETKVHGLARDVARHIDHVVKIAGIDHVGLGSDFEGSGDSLPTDLKDVSEYPNLIAELLRLGYSHSDISKICGGNTLRVWREILRVSTSIQQ